MDQLSKTTIAADTFVPSDLNEPSGSSCHSLATPISLARCFGPLAQSEINRPPSASNPRAWLMCLISWPCLNGGFIIIASNLPPSL